MFSPDEELHNLFLQHEKCPAQAKGPPGVDEVGRQERAEHSRKQNDSSSPFAAHSKIPAALWADRIDELDCLPTSAELRLRDLGARVLKGDAPLAMRAFEECPEHA